MDQRRRRAGDGPEEIKRAVKEALDDKWKEDTTKQMTSLATQMTEGFAQVHTRQDTANGKLAKHDVAIDTLMEDRRVRLVTDSQRQEDRSRLKWLTVENSFK